MAVKNISEIKNWLLDMDGTIYLGEELIPGALDFLNGIKRRGGRAIFLTNNSSRAPRDYVEKLRRLGIEADQGDIFTSGDAAAKAMSGSSRKMSSSTFPASESVSPDAPYSRTT